MNLCLFLSAARNFDALSVLPSEAASLHEGIHKRVFMTYLRMSTHKESKVYLNRILIINLDYVATLYIEGFRPYLGLTMKQTKKTFCLCLINNACHHMSSITTVSLVCININFFLMEYKACTGEHWPKVRAVWTKCSKVCTKSTEGQYYSIRLEQGRVVSS